MIGRRSSASKGSGDRLRPRSPEVSIDNTGSSLAVSGTFSGLPEGAEFYEDAQWWRITYTGAPNVNGTRTLTTAVSDGTTSASATSTVNSTAVNDAPTATNLSAGDTNGQRDILFPSRAE